MCEILGAALHSYGKELILKHAPLHSRDLGLAHDAFNGLSFA
jgi:hypothetical protein